MHTQRTSVPHGMAAQRPRPAPTHQEHGVGVVGRLVHVPHAVVLHAVRHEYDMQYDVGHDIAYDIGWTCRRLHGMASLQSFGSRVKHRFAVQQRQAGGADPEEDPHTARVPQILGLHVCTCARWTSNTLWLFQWSRKLTPR